FVRTQERLRPAQSIFHTCSKYVAINLHLLLLESHPDVEPNAVTYFIFCILERGPVFRECRSCQGCQCDADYEIFHKVERQKRRGMKSGTLEKKVHASSRQVAVSLTI